MIRPRPEGLPVVLSGTIAGAEGAVEMRRRTRLHMAFLRRFLPSASGIPSHDTLDGMVNAVDAELFAAASRDRHVGNRGHWTLDVVFHEDLGRFRAGTGPHGMATIRRSALDLPRGANNKHSLEGDNDLGAISRKAA